MSAYIEKFNNEQRDFEMFRFFNLQILLDQRIDTLTYNLVIGLFLVCLVLGLFLSLKLSLWVAFGIPFSLLE